MDDELKICIAAIFLNKGRDVITSKEFPMYVSLDLRWMPVKDAQNLMAVLSNKKMIEVSGEYLKPSLELSDIDIPVAYRPSERLLDYLNSFKSIKPTAVKEVFPRLVDVAVNKGANKGKFVSECNKISRTLNIDMEVAAMLALRDMGVDTSPFIDDVKGKIQGK